jgi:RNA polymerase sigma-70 factor, ECF subfamily
LVRRGENRRSLGFARDDKGGAGVSGGLCYWLREPQVPLRSGPNDDSCLRFECGFTGASMDETELIAAARMGNEDAFAQLYRQHGRYVRAIGRSILRADDLDDMCQDTFLLAFTRLNRFEGNSQFRTWITRIAINQCLLRLRRARQASNGESQLVQMDPEMAEEALDRVIFASTDTQLESVPARLDLNRLLQVLKPGQRRILEMAYVEGMPDREIAEVLGIPVRSVINKIYRAKRIVRKKTK